MSTDPQVELVVRAIAQTAVDNEKAFGDLDAVVGDGDFGYSLARGFENVLEGWDDIDRTDTGTFLKKVGMVITARIGGTSGPIWGTAFLRAGTTAGATDTLTGAQVKDYLETSAAYFGTVSGTGPFPASAVTNAVTPTAPNGTPDYNYDIMGGLDARLTYEINIAKDAGSRIEKLSYAGAPIDPTATFVVAINNYRQGGGGNFPHVKAAPVVYNRTVEIRQLMIDWVTANKVIDPPSFSTVDWKLTSGGAPVVITP